MPDHRPLPRQPAAPRRRLRWVVGLGAAGLVCGFGLALAGWALGAGPAQFARALNGRAPMDLVRYAETRLIGHPRLQRVLLPVTAMIRQRLEREPGPLSTQLGKGQQPGALPSQRIDSDGRPLPAPAAMPAADLESSPPPRWRVASTAALEQALLDARPGDTVEIEPGRYRIAQTLHTWHAGTPEQPIVVRARAPGSVQLQVFTEQAFLVNRPYWRFENLNLQGACAAHADCEHAFHVVGAAVGTVIRNNRMADFNAQVKVNGEAGEWPDHGLLQFNTLIDSAPRDTDNPVTPVDLVGASGWQFMDNLVEGFVKRGGNQVSFGLFMKGAGSQGRIERNLVVCTPAGISQPGLRVGISLGGGGTDPRLCRDPRCATEHADGIVANNIVAHCNDAGIDIHASTGSLVAFNTLINTQGILVRDRPAQAEVVGNLMEGSLLARQGGLLRQAGNLKVGHLVDWLWAPDALDLRWRAVPELVAADPRLPTDFCGRARPASSLPGALAAGPCGAAKVPAGASAAQRGGP